MRILTLTLIYLLAGAALTVPAQQSPKRESPRYVVVPPEYVQLVVAVQPDCPLQLESARLLFDVMSSDYRLSFEFRNRGSKPIAGFSADEWSVAGGGGSLTPWEAKGRGLLPGQSVRFADAAGRQIVPLTDGLRGKIKAYWTRKGVKVLMVRYVRFLDGSVYSAEKSSEELGAYLGTLNDEGVPTGWRSPE